MMSSFILIAARKRRLASTSLSASFAYSSSAGHVQHDVSFIGFSFCRLSLEQEGTALWATRCRRWVKWDPAPDRRLRALRTSNPATSSRHRDSNSRSSRRRDTDTPPSRRSAAPSKAKPSTTVWTRSAPPTTADSCIRSLRRNSIRNRRTTSRRT